MADRAQSLRALQLEIINKTRDTDSYLGALGITIDRSIGKIASIMDQCNIADVDTAKIVKAQQRLHNIATGKESLEDILKDPSKRTEFVLQLKLAKFELQKLERADVKNPLIAEPLRQISDFLSMIRNYEKDLTHPQNAQKISGDLAKSLNMAIPFAQEKVKAAQTSLAQKGI